MMLPTAPSPSPTPDAEPTPASLGVLLGLVDDARQSTRQLNRLLQVASAWPITLAATVAAAIAAFARQPALSWSLLWLLPLVAGAVGALPVLMGGRAERLPFHQRTRVLAAAAFVLGLGFGPLFLLAMEGGEGVLDRIAVIALAGAGIIAASALQPVRAASLGLLLGMVIGMAALLGFGWETGALVLLAAARAASTLRLVRLDHRTLLDQAARTGEGRLAAKMIAEFEGHGTGWFWEADREGRVTYLSAKVAAEIAAYGTDPIGRPLTDIFRMDATSPGTERTLAFHLSSRTSFSDYSVCAAGDRVGARWWSISGRPVIDEHGRFSGFIGSGADLTERRRSEAEITRLALFDGLTGLANRQRMRLSLDKTLAHATMHGRPAALFLMDLDRFKTVNDTLGHQAGDALLKQVAQRLQRGVGYQALVGRLGGDEFQVLLPGLGDRDALGHLARELIAAVSQPYFISGKSLTIGCSIGVAIAPDDGEDAETLIRNADLALYAAKADGRGVHRFYSAEMLAGATNRKQLEDDLRDALATGGFHLCYQPIVSTKDTHIVGYEALIRWSHPTRGLISPAEFIPVAEECGLIEAIGEWVLRTACNEAAKWPHEVRVAVNVSPIQFANPSLPGLVTSALARSGLPPHRLELEITEGVFLDETSSSEAMFASLKGIGVRLALDDFGTGYSSLGYLRTAPFDKIKIDQSFVRGAAQPGNRNAAIISAIVTLAETLHMETTAEGVEVQDEIDLVRGLGCSHIQGYVYGRPMLAEDVVATLAAGGGYAVASGFKISRSPRTRMLRSARIAIDGVEGEVRIRDMSATGAMIEGIAIDGDPIGLPLLIELLDDQMFSAQVRWANEGKAGLQFAETFDLARLAPVTPARPLRQAS